MANKKRLIDANALIDVVDESKLNNPHPPGMVRVNHRNEHDHFLRMILDAPTVDAVAKIAQTAERRMIMAYCKLGGKGCWKDSKCHYSHDCENKVLTNADRIRAMVFALIKKRKRTRPSKSFRVEIISLLTTAPTAAQRWIWRNKNGRTYSV